MFRLAGAADITAGEFVLVPRGLLGVHCVGALSSRAPRSRAWYAAIADAASKPVPATRIPTYSEIAWPAPFGNLIVYRTSRTPWAFFKLPSISSAICLKDC